MSINEFISVPIQYVLVETGLQIKVCNVNFSYFSTKTHVVGTQKNHLNEMGERSGSVVECFTRDREAAGSSSLASLHCGP